MSTETIQALINTFSLIIPECILGVAACVLFLGGTFKTSRNVWGTVALLSLIASGVALWLIPLPTFTSEKSALAALYAGPIWLDPMGMMVKMLMIAGGAVMVLFTWRDMEEDQAGEHHGCMLLIIAGACFVASANEMVTLFLSLELISIPTYVLLYLSRKDTVGQESALKYFLLSILSSAMLLFGLSYLYGISGTTNIQGMIDALSGPETVENGLMPGIMLIAVVMIVAGLGFKIAAVPFHFYAPDVYQGASMGSAALLAFVPKVAGFVAMIRVLGLVPYQLTVDEALIEGGGPIAAAQVSTLLWILAAVTMTLGNVLALLQNNVKRMLAYSSVAHAGYMLIGLSLAPYQRLTGTSGVEAVLFYLVSYAAMTIGSFGILAYLSSKSKEVDEIDELSGLSTSHPKIALLMGLFLFSLIGMPATAGFMGKFLLFFKSFSFPIDATAYTAKSLSSAEAAEMVHHAKLFRILTLIGAVNAAIAAWYYLRVIAVMYLRKPLPEALPQNRGFSPRLAAIWICAIATIALGVYPKPLSVKTREAIAPVTKVTTPQATTSR